MSGPLTTLDLRGTDTSDPRALRTLLPRPKAAEEPPIEQVREVIERVRIDGDAALRELTARFDDVEIDDILVDPDDVAGAPGRIPAELRSALETAHANITAYHQAQLHDAARYERDGLVVRELRRPVDRAGLYVPSALAPLLSTALMTAVPAKVADVPETVLCTAPGPDGRVDDGILAAAAIAGVDEVVRVAGPAAVAALAHGTESIRPVDVIVGPGSARVAQAKREVATSGLVGVPSSFAGPSEVVVVADASAVVDDVAIDVVLQAEHGPDGLAWLICWDDDLREAVDAAVARIVVDSPRREHIEATLADAGYAVVVDGPEAAIDVANVIAPEHLELQTADPEALLPRVRHAGAVFCGPWAPASVGDYVAGPNHVLPTYGSARFGGALRVDDFCKHVHVVSLDRAALGRLAPHVEAMAAAEGLPAHAQSVRQRVRR
ncbi:MAG: histidinol dehydrogenase [Acidimicrobiales bacterium]|nr:histidinol dehydrogenase [Acidimicrobiales bacterium]